MESVRWFGHSMWEIVTPECTIVTDPFNDIGYPMPRGVRADILLSSHAHHDHSNFSLISGAPVIYREAGVYQDRGFHLEMRPAAHDGEGGARRGQTLLMKFTIGGRTYLHCGDLGCYPDEETLTWMKAVDVMFLPVGGRYTIDAGTAWKLVQTVEPGIVFPQHYKTACVQISLETVERFLTLAVHRNPRRVPGDLLIFSDNDFDRPQVIVFQGFDRGES